MAMGLAWLLEPGILTTPLTAGIGYGYGPGYGGWCNHGWCTRVWTMAAVPVATTGNQNFTISC